MGNKRPWGGRATRRWMVALVVVGVLAACGDSGGSTTAATTATVPVTTAAAATTAATSASTTASTTTAAPSTTAASTKAAPLPDPCTLVTVQDLNAAIGAGFARRDATGCSFDRGAYLDRASGSYRVFVNAYNGASTFPYRGALPSDWTAVSGLGTAAREFVGTGTNYLSLVFVELAGENAFEVKVMGNDSRATGAVVEALAKLVLSRLPK